MITAAVVAMTVLGCNDHSARCDVITRPAQTWTSKKSCEAAIPGVLSKPINAPYPVIIARCEDTKAIAVAPLPEQKSAEPLQLQPTPSETAPVVMTADDFEKASETEEEKTFAGKVLYRTKNGYALVKKGTVKGFEKLRKGTKTSIKKVKSGVDAAIDTTVDLTKRSVGAVKNLLTPKKNQN